MEYSHVVQNRPFLMYAATLRKIPNGNTIHTLQRVIDDISNLLFLFSLEYQTNVKVIWLAIRHMKKCKDKT